MNRRFSLACFALILLSPAWCLAQGTPTPTSRKPLSPSKWKEKLEPGDIVFIRSRSNNAPLIAALSNENEKSDADNVFTHCGIIFKDSNKELRVYEGEGRGAGEYLTVEDWQKKVSDGKVDGVPKSQPLHNVYVMRWKGEPVLAPGLDKILTIAKQLHDKYYDHGFSWTDTRAYCSELIWKAYAASDLFLLKELPTMEKYVKGAPDHADKIKGMLEEAKAKGLRDNGYDPNESAISPEDIYKSPHLTPITD
jgi:hypothetical protein